MRHGIPENNCARDPLFSFYLAHQTIARLTPAILRSIAAYSTDSSGADNDYQTVIRMVMKLEIDPLPTKSMHANQTPDNAPSGPRTGFP
jgi:hypothetical protein